MSREDRTTTEKDKNEIDKIVNRFFDLFTNIANKIPDIRKIDELFLPEGILINNTPEPPAIYDLESFIEPREKMLTDGTLIGFIEEEVSHQTEVFGNIAQRSSQYKKSGILNGEPFEGKGRKLMQFIKNENRWFLAAVVWRDEK